MTETKRKSVPLYSEEKLLTFSLAALKKYERLLRNEFETVKADASIDMVKKLRTLRAIKSTVAICVKIIKIAVGKDSIAQYKKSIPALKGLREYMNELAESLNDLKDDLQIPVTYCIRCPEGEDVHGAGLIDRYLSNFKTATLVKDNRDFSLQHDFSLRFQCYKENDPDIRLFAFREVGNVSRIKLAELLRKGCNLKFDFSEEACADGKFMKFRFDIKPVVDIEFKFEGNSKTGHVDLTIQNGWGLNKKGEFGVVELHGNPANMTVSDGTKTVIDDAAIEALIRTVMRYPSRLFEFFDWKNDPKVSNVPYKKTNQKTQPKRASIAEILDRIQDDNQKVKEDYQDIKEDNLGIKEAIKVAKEETRKTLEELEETVKSEHIQTREANYSSAKEQQKQNATLFGWLFAALSNRKNR